MLKFLIRCYRREMQVSFFSLAEHTLAMPYDPHYVDACTLTSWAEIGNSPGT
jgi:hypothetical protein